MDENAPARAADDADRSPFRRFPWGPALLCVACLAMAGYTWMRYSYAWDVTVAHLRSRREGGSGDWPDAAYVQVRGDMTRFKPFGKSDDVVSVSDPGWSFLTDVLGFVNVKRWPAERDETRFRGTIRGRVRCRFGLIVQVIDNTASRFHPASVAGLAVGAMGCFIFGLYLRRWLRERRAAA